MKKTIKNGSSVAIMDAIHNNQFAELGIGESVTVSEEGKTTPRYRVMRLSGASPHLRKDFETEPTFRYESVRRLAFAGYLAVHRDGWYMIKDSGEEFSVDCVDFPTA